jgi:hypothetical protein
LKNASLRFFQFRPKADLHLQAIQWIQRVRHPGHQDAAPGPRQEQWFRARSESYVLQWSVDQGEWKETNDAILWPPGVTHEIRYRLAQKSGVSGCQLRGVWKKSYRWFEDRRGPPGEWDVYERRAEREESDRVVVSQFIGSIGWSHVLEEFQAWGERSEQLQGLSEISPETLSGPWGEGWETFDCPGWVS